MFEKFGYNEYCLQRAQMYELSSSLQAGPSVPIICKYCTASGNNFLQSEVTVEAEDLKISKQKLTRKLNELREELARETSLRSSLEESHNSLLTRIKEMEVIVEKERGEVRMLKVHLHWAKAIFFFDLCHCSVWTLNCILFEPFWKWRQIRFWANVNCYNLEFTISIKFSKEWLDSKLGLVKGRWCDG